MKVNIIDKNFSFQTNICHTKSFYKILKENPSKMSEYRLYASMLYNNGKNDVLLLSNTKHENELYIQAHVYDVRENLFYSGSSFPKNISDKDTCNGMFLPNIIDLYEQASNNVKLGDENDIEKMRWMWKN